MSVVCILMILKIISEYSYCSTVRLPMVVAPMSLASESMLKPVRVSRGSSAHVYMHAPVVTLTLSVLPAV